MSDGERLNPEEEIARLKANITGAQEASGHDERGPKQRVVGDEVYVCSRAQELTGSR